MRISRLLLVLCLLGFAMSESAACTACFGQSDSSMAKGMNMGIMALLMIITSVLFGVASFFVYLARRGSGLQGESQNAGLAKSLSQNSTNA